MGNCVSRGVALLRFCLLVGGIAALATGASADTSLPVPTDQARLGCVEERVDLRHPQDDGSIGAEVVTFSVEIADTPEERALGLMHRTELSPSAGMLFIFEDAQDVSFWMKNTLIPLDMIFIARDGRVVRVHENARPGDLTPIPSGAPVVAVLEINGGLAAPLGISRGTHVRHPALPQGAKTAWPCPNQG